jgi:hypothetical protein
MILHFLCVLNQLLMGTVGLQKVRANRVIVLIDKHKDKRISESTINAFSADARRGFLVNSFHTKNVCQVIHPQEIADKVVRDYIRSLTVRG